MKRLIPLLFVAVLLAPSLALAQDVFKGNTATVPGWEWVNVMNQEPVTQNFSNGTSQLGYGETCGIEIGGTVKVVGIDGKGNRVLVRYAAPGRPMGTSCPSGVLFFTTKEKFSKMTAEYKRIREAEQNEKALVKQLLLREPNAEYLP